MWRLKSLSEMTSTYVSSEHYRGLTLVEGSGFDGVGLTGSRGQVESHRV